MWRQGVIEMRVAAADAGLDHQARRADGAVVDQRAGQAVDRVAAEVLGDREDAAVLARRLDQGRQPRMVTAIGFSHITCRPASRQAVATAWCEPVRR